MRLIYLNAENLYAHDRHLIDGLREAGHEIHEICEKGSFRARKRIKDRLRKENPQSDPIMVGFPSPVLVLVARTITTGTIYFNAVSSQYEANVVSRGVSIFTFQAIKCWLLDFISFHLSNKILLESESQLGYISKLFFISKKKLVKSYSGINEKEFFIDPSVKKRNEFTVLFRGRFLPESGILTVIKAAKKLENTGVKFLIIGHGFLYREVNALMDTLKPTNVTMIHEKIAINELRKMMLSCHISLGQLADHPRLERTLPCKLFESLALGLPYVTGRNPAALEILTDGETCITVNPDDADDLAKKILEAKAEPQRLEKIAKAGHRLYEESLTSKKLAVAVLERIMGKQI